MSLPVISCEPHIQRAAESLAASPLGQRLKLTEDQAREIASQPSIVMALVSLFAPDLPSPDVRLVNLPIAGVSDDGFWLNPKSLGLPPFGSLELIDVDRQGRRSIYGKAPHAVSLSSYSKPRLRVANRSQLSDQARRSTVLICFEADFIDPAADISWLRDLRPEQFVIVSLDPRRTLQTVIRLINAGALLREHVVLTQSTKTTVPLCAITIEGFNDPLDVPIPLPQRNAYSSNYAALHLADDSTGQYQFPRMHISESHVVDESGAVTLIGTNQKGPPFSLGILDERLPRIARLAYAIATSSPETDIQINGTSIALPPLHAEVSVQEVSKTVADHTRKRRGDRLKTPRYPHGRSLLSVAILKAAPAEVIADLLNIGLDPDEVDEFGWTPVMYAAALGLARQVLELVSTGFPDLDREVSDGICVADVLDYYGFTREGRTRDQADALEDAKRTSDSESARTEDASDAIQKLEKASPSITEVAVGAFDPIPFSYKPGADDVGLRESFPRRPLAESLAAILRSSPDAARAQPERVQTQDAPTPRGEADASEGSITKRPHEPLETSHIEPARTARQLSEVVPIYASVVDFPRNVSPGEIRGKILEWLGQASAELRSLDPTLPRHDSDRYAVLSDEDPETGLFALRFDNHAPNSFTYRTEFVVYPDESETIVSTRLQAIRHPGNDDDAEPSVPRIVSAFADLGARHRKLPVGRILPVVTEADSEFFASLVFDNDRVLPVLAVYGATEHLIRELPAQIRSAVLIVHVAPQAIASVQRKVGRDFIGYRGAWRIYPPGLKPESSRYDAPLILDPTTIPPGRLVHQIRHTIWRFTRSLTEDDAPTYLTARQLILHRQKEAQARIDSLRRESANDEALIANEALEIDHSIALETEHLGGDNFSEVIQLHPPSSSQSALEARIAHLVSSVAELSSRLDQVTREHRAELQSAMDEARLWRDLAEETEAKVSGLLVERDAARKEVFDLRTRLSMMTSGEQDEDDSPQELDYPTSFEGLEDWVESRYEGRVHITKKALKAARSVRSEPYIVKKAYEAIDLLANEYIDAKAGGAQARERLLERQRTTQLEVTKVGEAINNHRYADEYFATVGGARLRLDMHVREFGGTDFNPERQLRIYFNLDESNGRVVIGHLPTHLTSSHT